MAIDDADSEEAGNSTPATQTTSESESDPESPTEPQRQATVGEYSWEDYKQEYYYDDDGSEPEEPFDANDHLHLDVETIGDVMEERAGAAKLLAEIRDENTVFIDEDLDEDAFFSDEQGNTTIVNRYDLEKSVPEPKKSHFYEVDRYWVNKPYAYVIIFHSEKENEKKYYVIEPYLTSIEYDLREFLSGKLKTAIKYSSDEVVAEGGDDVRSDVIDRETRNLLDRYDLYNTSPSSSGRSFTNRVKQLVGRGEDGDSDVPRTLTGLSARPEPALLNEDSQTLSEYQVQKLLYLLKRDFIGYQRIDGIKHDINIEDISCDGYNSPVFVYHSDFEQIISNVYHGEEELDDFVVKLAQRSGKGISKRSPQVDATLPDGSRAQLTLGLEVSDHGTNYTIRQFKDVPFTPIDLINWKTFSLEEMAFLWLCIESHKSLIFAGGTASGKTTSLNAVSLFIPSKAKIVSIEDTREVELPQRNWIASVTRPSFTDDGKGDVDEFDLLEAALRQRPEYIVMGEIRGEEGRTLFQVMSTGHTTLTTFHADSVGEVIKRFTTQPISVSKTMFTALDLVSVQTSTRVQGNKVRRNKSITEINHYDAENDEVNVQDIYQWQAETDEFLQMGQSNTLEKIMFDRGWSHDQLQREMFQRKIVLAYLIQNGLNTYAQVAAALQAFINDPDSILTLIANNRLEKSLEDLRDMESVKIAIDPKKEEMVPRPDANDEMLAETNTILENASGILEEYQGKKTGGLVDALTVQEDEDIEVAAVADEEGDADDTDEEDDADDTDEEDDADDTDEEDDADDTDEEGDADDTDEEDDFGGFSFERDR